MANLNPAQRSAVRTLKGPLLVLAGAGSGKTRVIAHRTAALVEHGVKPERILAVTFTNKAAREMRERVSALLGKRRRSSPEISTFHSLCVRILRRQGRHVGLGPRFAIYDRGDQEGLARAALRDVHVGPEKLRPGDLIAIVGGWKTRGIDATAAMGVARNDKEELAALAYGRYAEALRAAGAVDFDDLLLRTVELFERAPEAQLAEARRFDHVLIDEYQDTNDLQYRIVRALAGRHRNLCVVGDDDQSIYGWRGAEVTHILSFKSDWPGAKVVRLEENYRSRAPILEAANRLIAFNRSRHDKVLRPMRGGGTEPRILRFDDEVVEAQMIVGEIRRRVEAPPGERESAGAFAILFRTNEQPRPFEMELRRAKLPYVLVGGQSFYDRREVRDVLAYLKVLVNPEDEVSLLRILNVPTRGVGQGTAQVLIRRAVEAACPVWHVLTGSLPELPAATVERLVAFRSLIEGYAARLETQSPSVVLRSLIGEIDYRSELERVYKTASDVESRWASVEEVVSSLARHEERSKDPDVRSFLDDLALDAQDADDEDPKAHRSVKLMTLHSAKGLEFPHVFMVGMEEDILPHKRSVGEEGTRGIDEERRLAYVGVTRGMESVSLSFTRSRMKWGTSRPSIPSRFLAELQGDAERARRIAAAAEARRVRAEADGAGGTPDAAPADRKRRAPSKRAATPAAPEGSAPPARRAEKKRRAGAKP